MFKCSKCGSEVRKYITISVCKEHIIKKNRKNGKCTGKTSYIENITYQCIKCQEEWHDLKDASSGWEEK
ncbi:hypothetical protein [Fusobacterium sp.]|uniref:hypothetical protein n=1 Tax=Fusobacterium sp. TaxID=68766 RepID=UPI0026312777|nr:hypothetical protein [Fusobacterium sp.]